MPLSLGAVALSDYGKDLMKRDGYLNKWPTYKRYIPAIDQQKIATSSSGLRIMTDRRV